MKVNYEHPDYTAFKPRWDIVDDVSSGPFIMQQKASTYLMKIADFKNQSQEQQELSDARNKKYHNLARFSGFTGSTVTGFVGLMFMREPELSVPPSMADLLKDIDGSGVTLEQQAKSAGAELVKNSRVFLWTDYPSGTSSMSKADQDKLNIRPVINKCDAKDVINWWQEAQGGLKRLTLAVIPESYVYEDDGFERKYKPQWRVLRMIKGVYTVEVYRTDEKGQFNLIEELTSTPTDHSGKHWEFIPATFVGAVNNDSSPDEPMMEEIAHLNIGHYRNSADLEISSHDMCPTVAVKMDRNWYENVLNKQINMGGGIPLPPEGGVEIVQAEPNNLALQLKGDKKMDMIGLCARIIDPQKTQRTATEVTGDTIQYTSRLSSVADNLSSGYTFMLNCMARFLGLPEECVYKLNTNYNTNAMSPQERQQLITEWVQGAISDYDYWRNLTAQGVVSEPFDEWMASREAGKPTITKTEK